jgi:putative nucleotidyltransferase with HDIG domain
MRGSIPEASASQPPRMRRHMAPQDIPWPARARVLTLWLVVGVLSLVILVVRLPLAGQVELREGDVASADVIASRQVTYVSESLTKQRRDLAANAVPEIFDPPQARVGRQQLNLANRIVEFIGSVRADSYSDLAAKVAQIKTITAIDLPPEVISRTVTLPNPAWERAAAEVPVVLERAMREEIRENNLADERRRIPARVRLDLSDEEATVVSALVEDLVIPNSFYNAERTEQRRQSAREQVEPVTTTIERNETILRAGDIVSGLDLEALEALGMRQPTRSWKDVIGTAAFLFLLGILFLYYFWRIEPPLWLQRTEPLLIALLTLIFVLFARLAIPFEALLPYFFPYAALAMMLSVLVNQRLALVVAGLFVLLVGWLTDGNLALMTFAFAGSLAGTLKLRRGDHLADFALAAFFVVLTNLLTVFAFMLTGGKVDARTLVELVVAALVNGLLTITVTLLGVYLIGLAFGVITPLQLIELSRPTHPLLRQLLLKAPGTYHHTLIVSNMAERAAEAINADSLLTRVGTYYHDIGKTIRPYFFIENRTETTDPHSRLDPYTSAQIIISHVKDGIGLAKKHRLPQRVIDFIPEHHGTLLVSYFYHQATRQAGSADTVAKDAFRYPGPKPQTVETAITMLADGAEATVRSKRPATVEEVERIVAESIEGRMVSGQLDECPLTLDDLREIQRAFVDVLRGLQHPRVTYPTDAMLTQPLAQPAPEAPPQPAEPTARPAKEERRGPTTNRDSGASRAV